MAVDDANTVCLLHFDVTSGSTVFVDESGKTWTPHGSSSIVDNMFRFPDGCGLFNGSTGYIDTGSSVDFQFNGVTDFTIDCWVKPTFGAEMVIFDALIIGGTATRNDAFMWVITSGGRLRNYNSGGYQSQTNGVLLNEKWNHIALISVAGNINYAINGVFDSVTGSVPNCTSGGATIGKNSTASSGYMRGYMDELRVSNIARWSASFTPQSYAYGGIPPLSYREFRGIGGR